MKNRNTPKYIGEKYFDFDVEYELIIYKFLCNIHLENKEIRKINEEHKFITYVQWKDYIVSKYKAYEDDMLIEFIHYLNQKIRNVDSGYEYYGIFIPILLTILSDKLYEQLITICNVEIHSILYVLGEIVFMAVIVIVSVFLIKKITDQMYEKSFEKNFYLNYKKEIERILRERNPDIQL